jgi:DNA-binding NtrC family response regulator
MVVLVVGVPGIDASSLPRSNGNLEFVAVESLAEALEFLGQHTCDTVMIGTDAPDMATERLSAMLRRNPLASEAGVGGSASTDVRAEAGTGSRDRGDAVENVFRSGSIRDMERLMILDRLARLNQNRTRSAESLEISVRTLRNKLRDYRTQAPLLVGVGAEAD